MHSRVEHMVGMVDVDAVQINFAVYFRWMDHGFQALLRTLDHPLSTLIAEGHSTPAVDAHCNYKRPVGLDDRVVGTCWIAEVGGASFVAAHRFECDGEIVARGEVKHVWIASGPPARPESLPSWLQNAAVPEPD